MRKSLSIFLAALFFVFLLGSSLVVEKASAAPSNTTCQDKKTTRVSGKVWDKIIWGNHDGSTGVKDVTVEIKRGDGVALRVQTGKGYRTDDTGRVLEVRQLYTTGEAPGPRYGIWDVCGFVYDAEWYEVDYRGDTIPERDYRPKNGVAHPKTLFTVKVVAVPAGYVNKSFTTFNPTFMLTRGSVIPGTQNFNTAVNTAYGATEYTSQIANSSAQAVDSRSTRGKIVSCNQNFDNDNDTDTRDVVKHRCDFLITKGTQYDDIGGRIMSSTGLPLSGVKVIVYNDTTKTSKTATSDSGGMFFVTGFVARGTVYAVRVDQASVTAKNHVFRPGTVTITNSFNNCTKKDTPYGSASYECQLAGVPGSTTPRNDCASWPTSGGLVKNPVRCDFMYMPIPTVTPTRIPPTATPISRPTLTPTKIPTGTPTRTVSPTITATPTPMACEAQAADIVLILDRSSSIASNIGKEKAAAKQFIGGLSQTPGGATGKVRVGVVTYYRASTIVSGMVKVVPGSAELRSLNAAIDGIQYISGENGSCIKCGETSAHALLTGSTAAKKAVILMSDGRANASGIPEYPYPAINQPMKDAVTAAQNSGYTYYAVGYGSTSRTRGDVLSSITKDSKGIGTGTNVDETLLNAKCAYPPTKFANVAACRYDYEPDPNMWASSFADIGGEICPQYRTAILNYRVVSSQPTGGVIGGLFNLITNILRSTSERTYADY